MNNSTHPLAEKTIYLVEDNTFLSDVMRIKFTKLGATVVTYADGASGLNAIRESLPDLILLDIVMPEIDGYEVLETIKKESLAPDIPVLVISNSGQPVEIERIMNLGAYDYIVKANFDPDEVVDKVRTALGINGDPSNVLATDITLDSDVQQGTDKLETPVDVFVVEDDPMLRNLLSMKLSKSHCPYMFSNDGSKAVELMRDFKPQVVVLDLMLPGMDGFEILKAIRADAELGSVPVFVFTNKNSDEDKARVTELGAQGFYVKAMTDLNEFVNTLRSAALQST